MNLIVKHDEKTGKYVAQSAENPNVKATANTFYDAVEELRKLEEEFVKVS